MIALAPCVLTINAGSSSVKFAVYRVGDPLSLELHGKIDRIGLEGTHLIVQDTATGQQESLPVAVADHSVAAMFLIDWLEGRKVFDAIRAVGHRVVHGMAHAEPTFVTTTLVGELHRITPYAPDHLPQELGLIQALHHRHPGLPQLACFDTSFHCTAGIGIWHWASNDAGGEPDVVMACCGDVPTLETLAAVSILRQHLPELKIRVVNVVDLMRLQPELEHPHGLSDTDFDALFTQDKPVIFAFHAYPWLIHRLTYRRTNHDNIHVRGYKEEGTITTPFDMTVLNDLDRFHLVMDTLDRLPQTGERGLALKEQLKAKLIEHKHYIDQNGQDMPEVRDWKWTAQ